MERNKSADEKKDRFDNEEERLEARWRRQALTAEKASQAREDPK
jgi:hypothetical protein